MRLPLLNIICSISVMFSIGTACTPEDSPNSNEEQNNTNENPNDNGNGTNNGNNGNNSGGDTNDWITLSSSGAGVAYPNHPSEILVQSSGNWSISGSWEYVNVSPTSGKNGDVITFSPTDKLALGENLRYTYTITCGKRTIEFEVTRVADSFSVHTHELEETFNFAGKGGLISLRIYSTFPYDIVCDDNWINLSDEKIESETEAYYYTVTQKVLTFTVSPNEDSPDATTPRSSKLEFKCKGKVLASYRINEEGQPKAGNISFKDQYAKQALVELFDTDGDGELSYREAANVESFEYNGNQNILGRFKTVVSSLDDLQYFIRLKSFSTGAFAGSSNLVSVTLPPNLTSVGYSVFQDCTRLTDITIHNNITSIGPYTFHGCTALKSINIPSSVVSISSGTFWESGLTSINIPGSVKNIGDLAFYMCQSLSSVTLNEGLETIGKTAFSLCPFESITIPNSVTTLGDSPIMSCNNLKSIKGKFASEDGRLLIRDGFNVVAMAPAGLTTYSIPEGIVQLSFACSLPNTFSNFVIPSTVTSIEGLSIGGGSSLRVYCKPKNVPSASRNDPFNSSCKIYVPNESLSQYKATWSGNQSQIYG